MHDPDAQHLPDDLALEPGRLAGLEHDQPPDAVELRAHVARCERCAADLASWRRTWRQVDVAVSGTDKTAGPDERSLRALIAGDDVDAEMVRVPSSLRARTLAAAAATPGAAVSAAPGVVATPATPGAAFSAAPGAVAPVDPVPGSAPTSGQPARPRSTSRRWLPWLAAAAALVIAIGAGAGAWSRSVDIDRVRTENAALVATTGTLDRVLAARDHWVTTLRSPDGTASSTSPWTPTEHRRDHDLAPGAGRRAGLPMLGGEWRRPDTRRFDVVQRIDRPLGRLDGRMGQCLRARRHVRCQPCLRGRHGHAGAGRVALSESGHSLRAPSVRSRRADSAPCAAASSATGSSVIQAERIGRSHHGVGATVSRSSPRSASS